MILQMLFLLDLTLDPTLVIIILGVALIGFGLHAIYQIKLQQLML